MLDLLYIYIYIYKHVGSKTYADVRHLPGELDGARELREACRNQSHLSWCLYKCPWWRITAEKPPGGYRLRSKYLGVKCMGLLIAY